MKTKTIKTQVVKTVTKRITHLNGFVFNYTLTSINNSNDVFSLESITNLGDNYQYYITPEQQKIIKEIPFNDTRAIFNNSTLVRSLLVSEEDILSFDNYEHLYKGKIGNLEFLTDLTGTILNPVLPVNSVYIYQDYSYDNTEELKSIRQWMLSNSDKVEIKGTLEINSVPHYNQNETFDLHCFEGNIIVHDPKLLAFFHVKNKTSTYFSLSEGMSKLLKHILKEVTEEQSSLILARNFASPMIIQRAKEIYTSKNTDMLYPDSLSDFTSTCLILGEIHNPSSYTNLLTTINLDEATTQCLICLTILELIQNNGEIV